MTTPICGYVVAWDAVSGVIVDDRGARHRLIAERGCLDGWLDLGLAVPLAVQHGPVITYRGVHQAVGAMRQFRADDFGVLTLGELDDTDVGASIAESIRLGHLWAFSVGWATDAEIPYYPHGLVIPTVRMRQAAIREVSVTNRPGFTDCKIVGLGDTAELAWQFPDLASMALQARGDEPPPRSRRW
jgi:phage head maturation protease